MNTLPTYKVGIVIPNWNGEQRISVMLESILCQDFDNWKVFVVDDQSTDQSMSIIQEYVNKDPRFHMHVRNQETKGAQTCRNIGFELTKGAEYVCFFDNDDMVASCCLRQRTTFMDAHPELDFAIFPAKNYETSPDDNSWGFYGGRYKDDDLGAFLDRTLPMVGWTNIYRRDNYIERGLFWDTHLKSMQDSDFNIQAILKGCTYKYAHELQPINIDYFYYTSKSRNSVSMRINSIDHVGSNVYLINKIINSLSEEQKKKYQQHLQRYILSFIMHGWHRSFVQDILANRWVRNQRQFSFFLKLLLVSGMSQRLFLLLFRKHIKESNRKKKEWLAYMKGRLDVYHNL